MKLIGPKLQVALVPPCHAFSFKIKLKLSLYFVRMFLGSRSLQCIILILNYIPLLHYISTCLKKW